MTDIRYVQNTTLQALIQEMPQIMADEGVVTEIYLCPADKPTFGVGTLITPDMHEYGKPVGTKVSEARCAEAFFHELGRMTLEDGPAVFGEETWNSFPIQAKQVFINMLYNLGRSRFAKFERMIAAATVHHWQVAAIEAKDSKWYRQVGSRARRLVDRLHAIGES